MPVLASNPDGVDFGEARGPGAEGISLGRVMAFEPLDQTYKVCCTVCCLVFHLKDSVSWRVNDVLFASERLLALCRSSVVYLRQ